MAAQVDSDAQVLASPLNPGEALPPDEGGGGCSLLEPTFPIILLRKFLGGEAGDEGSAANKRPVHHDEDEESERQDSPREQAGSLLYSLACSPGEARNLLSLHVASVCADVLVSAEVTMTPRLYELAAGVVANIATHKDLRPALRRDASLLLACRSRFLTSDDAPTLREIARFFAGALRAGAAGEEEEEGGGRSGDALRSVLGAGVLAKACFVMHASADGTLLGAVASLVELVDFFEPALFQELVGDDDCGLGAGVAALIRSKDTCFAELESSDLLSVLRLALAVAEALGCKGGSGAPCPLAVLLPALPALADLLVAAERPPRVLAAAASALAAVLVPLSEAKRCSLPVHADLASALLDLVVLDETLHRMQPGLGSGPAAALELLAHQMSKEAEVEGAQRTAELIKKRAPRLRTLYSSSREGGGGASRADLPDAVVFAIAEDAA